MGASFSHLSRLLSQFEQEQFAALSAQGVRGIPDGVANGGVQFVSIEPGQSTERTRRKSCSEEPLPDDERVLPVVVGVGINYGQNTTALQRLRRWLVNEENEQPTIIDYAPQMRMALNKTLGAYHRNRDAWNGSRPGKRAQASNIPVEPGSDYILVATNFCPLITLKPWGEYGATAVEPLLAATGEGAYLKSLVSIMGSYADLWVGHGKDHWSRFERLRCDSGNAMKSWMLAFNLSGHIHACIANARRRDDPLYR